MYLRKIKEIIQEDLQSKMVILSGPRQCGKTTLAQEIADKQSFSYLNWDIAQHRKALLSNNLPEQSKLWIFDEIHKNRGWRNWLKGVFDFHNQKHQILVTGSARLELYSRGGDSLQGRYFKHHLHPLTLNEVSSGLRPFDIKHFLEMPFISEPKFLDDLLVLSGFPEPFSKGTQRFANRWKLQYGDLLLREDLQTLEVVKDVAKMELLFEQLGRGVGSVLSINALREDLEVAFDTVKNWLQILEKLYAVFRIPPFGPPKIRAVKKEQKLYFWDWTRAESKAAKMENLVAVHLLRLAHWMEDVEGIKTELRYFRTPQGHEVDFVLLKNNQPWMAVEVKSAEGDVDSNLKYFLERVSVEHAFQIHFSGDTDYYKPSVGKNGVRCLPASRFLANLP
jgi:uncharacterized protein